MFNNTNTIKIFNNLDLVLNISKYLIEPSILINGHYYNKKGNLILTYDIKYLEDQVNSYIKMLSNKYKYYINLLDASYIYSNDLLLFSIVNEINDINIYWRKINHSIYIDLNYIKYINREFGIYSYIHQENKISKIYLNTFYSLFNGYDLNIITKKIDKFLFNLRLYKFRHDICYIQGEFDEFLEFYNYDLSKFKPSSLLDFIKREEMILQSLLEDDVEF